MLQELRVSVTARSPAVHPDGAYDWEDSEDYLYRLEVAEAERLRLHNLRAEERDAANKAVSEAVAAYYAQAWYQTLWARARFTAYWFTYWARLTLALYGHKVLGWNYDKTYRKLGL